MRVFKLHLAESLGVNRAYNVQFFLFSHSFLTYLRWATNHTGQAKEANCNFVEALLLEVAQKILAQAIQPI